MKRIFNYLKVLIFGITATGPDMYPTSYKTIADQLVSISSSVYPPGYIELYSKSSIVQMSQINDVWKNVDRLLHPEYYKQL